MVSTAERGGWRSAECGVLTVIGRTVPLKPDQSAQLAAVLKPAEHGHPWPDEISSQRRGGRDSKKLLLKVQPTVVAEVSADAAKQAGQKRHGMRLVRVRADLRPSQDLSGATRGAKVERPAGRTTSALWRLLIALRVG